MKAPSGILYALALMASACTGAPRPAPMPAEPPDALLRAADPGCLWLLSSYCARPVDRSPAPRLYATAVLDARPKLPEDLRQTLDAVDYFGRLRKLVQEDVAFDLNQVWESAASETVRHRARVGLGIDLAVGTIPIEFLNEARMIRRRLDAEAARAVWQHNPAWLAVEAAFVRVRQSLIGVLRRAALPPPVRRRWISRLREVKLALPGQLVAFDDATCLSTDENAYYDLSTNTVTVCAGEFQAERVLETLAHELAHALDPDAQGVQHQLRSRLGARLMGLRREACGEASFSCDSWRSFREDLPGMLTALRGFRVALPEFQSCLQSQPPAKELSEHALWRLAEAEVSESIAALADQSILSSLLTARLNLADGRVLKNPAFQNPCRYEALGPSVPRLLDDPVHWLIFVMAEYRCGGAADPAGFARAVETAMRLGTDITRELVRSEGRYSSRPRLVTEGYASSPAEHFADTLARYVMADLLADPPRIAERRRIFLSGSKAGCSEFLRERSPPYLARIEQSYALDPHSAGAVRAAHRFTGPLREVLACRDDLPDEGCELGFEPGRKGR